MRRSLHFSDYFKSLVSVVTVLVLGSVASSSYAQKCVQSSSGTVMSMIGTDFDYDEELADKSLPYKDPREMYYSFTTALSGVRLLPDYGEFSGTNTYPFRDFGVNVNYNPVDVPNQPKADIKDSYYITDNLWNKYGSRPYAVAPRDNGNSYLVFHNITDGGMNIASIYLPYQTYKGRPAKVQVRFYVGNIGIEDPAAGGSEVSNYVRYDGQVPTVLSKNIQGNMYPRLKQEAHIGSTWGLDYLIDGREDVNRNIYNTQTSRLKFHGSRLTLGIGNGSGSSTTATYKYYGDEYYGLTAVNKVSTGVGNPSYVNINTASDNGSTISGENGQWYGWYEGELELNSAFYGGTNGIGTNNYFNIRVESSNISPYDFIAIDYINVKTAHICADADKYCPGDEVNFTAHNYADGVQLEWQQMVTFIMDDFAKNQYPAEYNKFIGKTNDVWKTVGGVTMKVNKTVEAGDTVIVKGFDDGHEVPAGWYTFKHSTDKSASVIPSNEVYQLGRSLVFRALDNTAEVKESFEVWVRPNLNCLNNKGTGIKGPDVVCMNDLAEFWATKDGNDTGIDPKITVNWFLEYVGKERDADLNSKLKGLIDFAKEGTCTPETKQIGSQTITLNGHSLIRDGKEYCQRAGFGPKQEGDPNYYADYNATYVRFDNNTLEEGVYRLGYTQSALMYEYDPKHPNDPTYAKVIAKPIDADPVVKYIRVYKSPSGVANILSGINQSGAINSVCASDVTGKVEIHIKDEIQHNLTNADTYNSLPGVTKYDKYSSITYVYKPYSKATVGNAVNNLDIPQVEPSTTENVPASAQGKSEGVDLIFKIDGLCNASKFDIGGDIKITSIGGKDFYDTSDGYCQSSVTVSSEVKKPEMEITCNNVNTQNKLFIAGPTTKDTSIVLNEFRIPQVVGDVCDTDPMVRFEFKDAKGTTVQVNRHYSEFKAGKVKLPLVIGMNRITYTFTDGCGNSASCEVVYEFRDVTPPSIDCDDIVNQRIYVSLDKFMSVFDENGLNHYIYNLEKGDSARVDKQYEQPDPLCSVNLDHHFWLDGYSSKSGLWIEDKMGVDNNEYFDGKIRPIYGGRWSTDLDLFSTGYQGYINKFDVKVSKWSKNYEKGYTYLLWMYSDVHKMKEGEEWAKAVYNYKGTITSEEDLYDTKIVGEKPNDYDAYVNLADRFIYVWSESAWRWVRGNVSYCIQRVSVVDDFKPIIDCKTDPIAIGTELDKCELSYDALLDTIKLDIPTAKEVCSSSENLSFRYEYWITPEGGTPYQFKSSSAPLKKGKYTLEIRVYKPNDLYIDPSVYASCEREITIVDKQGPTFDCDILAPIYVDVNKDIDPSMNHVFNRYIFKYASTKDVLKADATGPGAGPGAFGPGWTSEETTKKNTEATLEHIFEKNKPADPSVILAQVKDNCGEKVKVQMTLKRTKENDKNSYTEKTLPATTDGNVLLKELRNTKFYEGVNFVIYTFIDDSGNETTCEQQVVVASLPTFDPDCKDYTGKTFPVNENCQYVITKNDFHKNWMPGAATINYSLVYENDPLTCGYMPGTEEKKSVKAYADYVEIIDATGKKYVFNNSNKHDKTYVSKKRATCTGFGWMLTPGEYKDAEKREYTSAQFGIRDITEDIVLNLGTATITWYYSSGDDQLGICYGELEITDETAPVITNCIVKEIKKPALDAPKCVLPFGDSGVEMPTIEQLAPTDNCTTDYSDFTLTWTRSDGKTEFESDFEIGTTDVIFIVTDKAGNSAECIQPVEVYDGSVYFDCNVLKTPLVAPASDKCDADFDDIVDLGLPLGLQTEDCTDDTPIIGVPTRSDDAEFKSNFPKGTTTITWTFTDELGNEKVCTQDVIVQDLDEPVFDCDKITPNPLVYNTKTLDECNPTAEAIKAEFGEWVAIDNCAGEVKGEPWLLTGTSDDDRVELPATFATNNTYTIAWVFDDKNNNVKVCRQTLIVKDDIAPVPSGCPEDKHIPAADGVCVMTWDQLNLPTPAIPDPCEGTITASKIKVEAWIGGEYVTYLTDEIKETPEKVEFAASKKEHIVHWIFVDKAGNEAECVQKIYIDDHTAPVVDCDPHNVFGDKNEYLFTVTSDNKDCMLSAAEFNKLFYAPVAYDECEDVANGTTQSPLAPSKIVRTYYENEAKYLANDGELIVDKNGDADMTADYPKGITVLHYEFVDESGNASASCDLPIKVVDKSAPNFDCDQITPIHAMTDASCEILFKNIAAGPYYGYDYCVKDPLTGDPAKIQATLQLDMLSISTIPEDYGFKVGEVYDLQWVVVDEDGNRTYCPQELDIESSGDLDLDCNDYALYEAKADSGTCFAKFDSLKMEKLPFAFDKCMPNDTIWGIPTRSDGLELTDDYPTNVTYIYWEFKSPYSSAPAARCTSKVMIYGNNPFPEIDCERLFPPVLEYADDCGPKGIELISKSQPDPCVAGYDAWAVPFTRDDEKKFNEVIKNSENKYIHSFKLGIDTVKWEFSDITDSVHAYCYQKIELLTLLPQVGDCPTDIQGDLTLDIPEGACSATPTESQMEMLKTGKWTKENPCITDEHGDPIIIEGVPSRSDGKPLNSPYRTTVTITWTFTDTTHTMKDSVTTCTTKVIISGVPELINCDRDFPTINEVLNNTCEYKYANVDNVPFPKDPCSGETAIVSLEVYKNSNDDYDSKLDGKDNILSFLNTYVFKPGSYRLHWNYLFTDNLGNTDPISCDQMVTIKSDKEPLFDCTTLDDTMKVVLPKGDCEANKDYVLDKLPKIFATDQCTGTLIPGDPRLDDGSEKGTTLPSIFQAGSDYNIIWIFENDSLTTAFKKCNNVLRIMSDSDPQFDCNTLDTVSVEVHGDCEIVLDPTMLPIPVATDSCTGSPIPATGAIAGTDKDVFATTTKFEVGNTTVVWTFKSPYVTGVKKCEQVVNVRTDKKLVTPCDVEPMAEINVPVKEGECVAPSPFIGIEPPYATNPCTGAKIKGVGTRSDDPDKTVLDSFRTGSYVITWTFTDSSMTLIDTVGKCTQNLVIGDINKPAVDCSQKDFEDKYISLKPSEGCEVSARRVGLSAPKIYDLCTGDLVKPDTIRTSGRKMSDSYLAGMRDTVVWTYIYKGSPLGTCKQEVAVHSEGIDEFNCSQLASKVYVTLTVPGSYEATYDEVVKAGLKLPKYNNVCKLIVETVKRKDNESSDKQLEDNYIIGETEITWTVTDTSATGESKVCTTIVEVVDQVIPDITCPPLPDVTYECNNALPDPYTTFDDFLAAGGTVSDPDRVNPATFNYSDTDNSAKEGFCHYTVVRKYFIKDLKEREISCEQVFTIEDKEPPIWEDGFVTKDYLFEDCGNVPSLPDNVRAYGGCTRFTYTMANKNHNDLSVTPENERAGYIYYEDKSNRTDDRKQCEYYSYDMSRTYIAYDHCKNKSNPVTITYQVRDTTAPKIDIPKAWSDSSIYAPWTKPCKFMVPDLKQYLPKGSISDPCDETLVLYFDTIQSPAPGEFIEHSMYVTLYVLDPCGNKDSVNKMVYVPTRETVVDVRMHDTTICSYPELKLSENKLSKTSGKLFDYIDGVLEEMPILFKYDFYKGHPDDIFPDKGRENLLHSTNPTTYSKELEALYGGRKQANAIGEKKIAMDRASKSGFYTIIAMDTATMCTDTAFANITVRERPRVKLDPTTYLVCEDDSIRLTDENLYDRFNVCVFDMGDTIKEEGWLLEDDLAKYNIDYYPANVNYNKMSSLLELHEKLVDSAKYVPNSLVPFTNSNLHLLYYATNSCGTGTSYDSYYKPCDGEFEGKTEEEIKEILGGSKNYNLYKSDSLMTNAEVVIDVKKRLHSSEFILTTKPQDKARVFLGENAELDLVTGNNPDELRWYRVNGVFDGRFEESFDRDGNIKPEYQQYSDEADELIGTTLGSEKNNKHLKLTNLTDTASYYALALDGVCPAVQTNVVSINVVTQIPTAFTPQNSIGLNDVFMEGYPVIIFNRYGQKMTESNNGWDGTCRGNLVDPGVYFYEVTLNNGETYKGSIEVVYFK